MANAKRKRLLGELEFLFKWQGLSEAHSDVDKLTKAVIDMSKSIGQSGGETEGAYGKIVQKVKELQEAKPDLKEVQERIGFKKDELDQAKEYLHSIDKTIEKENALKATMNIIIDLGKKVQAGFKMIGGELFSGIMMATKDTTGVFKTLTTGFTRAFQFLKPIFSAFFKFVKVLWGGMINIAVTVAKVVYKVFSNIFSTIKSLAGGIKNFASAAIKSVPKIISSIGSALATIGSMLPVLIVAIPIVIGLFIVFATIAAALTVALIALAAATIVIVPMLHLLVEGYKVLVATQEEFRLTNYRSIGSINETVAATARLSEATGLNNKEAMKTIKALSEAGLATKGFGITIRTASGEVLAGNEALDAMAEVHGKFTKATGVSSGITAKYLVRMNSLNHTLDRSEAMLTRLGVAQRDTGLSGVELGMVMEHLASQFTLYQGRISDDHLEKYSEGLIKVAQTAKLAGADVGDVVRAVDEMSTLGTKLNIFLRGFGENAGYATSEIAEALRLGDTEKQMEIAAAAFEHYMKSMNIDEDNVEQMKMLYKQMDAQFGLNENAIATFKMQAKIRKDGMTDRQKDMQKEIKLQDLYNKSLGTVTQQFQKIMAPILARVVILLEPIVEWFGKMFGEIEAGVNNQSAIWVKVSDAVDIFNDKIKTALSEISPELSKMYDIIVSMVKWIFLGGDQPGISKSDTLFGLKDVDLSKLAESLGNIFVDVIATTEKFLKLIPKVVKGVHVLSEASKFTASPLGYMIGKAKGLFADKDDGDEPKKATTERLTRSNSTAISIAKRAAVRQKDENFQLHLKAGGTRADWDFGGGLTHPDNIVGPKQTDNAGAGAAVALQREANKYLGDMVDHIKNDAASVVAGADAAARTADAVEASLEESRSDDLAGFRSSGGQGSNGRNGGR